MASDGSVVIEILADDKKAKSTLGSFKDAAGSALKGLTTVVAGAATAVGGLAAASIKVGSSFEASMSQVAATMGITTDEIANGSDAFELLTQAAKDAGATTAFSASEASEALNYLALAGYDAEKAADALPAVLNLAAAGSMDLAYASDLATDAMAALGIEASGENLTAFGDQMAKTASKANTSVSQLGEAILTVGGTAKSLAGGTTELNAALGVLANRGIKGSEGGTALRNIILALSAPTDTAAAAMKGLGLEVYDAAGNMRPLNEVFTDLNAAMADMTEGEKTAALNEIFNKVDLKSAQALLAGCGEEFDNLADAIANSGNAMQDMADTQLDNLQGDLTILKSGLEGLGIAAYEGMQVPLRKAAQLATDMVGSISEAFKAGGLTAAVGAVGNVLAQMVTKLSSAAPMMINAGIQLIQSLVSGIQQNTPALAAGALSILTSLANGILTLLPQLADTCLTLVTELGNQIVANVPQLIPAAVETIAALVESLTSNLSGMIGVGIQVITALIEGLIQALPELITYVPEIVSNIANVINDNAPKLLLAAAKLILELVAGLIKNIPVIIQNIPKIISAIVDAFTAFSWSNLGKSIITALKNGITAAKGLVKSAASDIANTVKEGISQLPAKMLEIGRNIVEGLWNGIKNAGGWLKDQVSGFVGGVVGTVKDLLGIHSPSKVFYSIGEYMMEGLAVGMENSKHEVMETAQDIVDEVKRRFDNLTGALETRQDVGDLEYKLWEMTDGSEASEAEKYSKQLEILEGQQRDQASIVDAAAAAYEAVVQQYGESSEESYKYQKQLLEEKIKYQELLQSIQDVIAAKQELDGLPSSFKSKASSVIGAESERAGTQSGQRLKAASELKSIEASESGAKAAYAVSAASPASRGREVVLNVNGREFARATLDDYRAVEDSNPRVVND